MAINHRGQMRPPIGATGNMRHIHRPSLIAGSGLAAPAPHSRPRGARALMYQPALSVSGSDRPPCDSPGGPLASEQGSEPPIANVGCWVRSSGRAVNRDDSRGGSVSPLGWRCSAARDTCRTRQHQRSENTWQSSTSATVSPCFRAASGTEVSPFKMLIPNATPPFGGPALHRILCWFVHRHLPGPLLAMPKKWSQL